MLLMTSYRRNFVPGGCQFFTVNLADRKSRLLTRSLAQGGSAAFGTALLSTRSATSATIHDTPIRFISIR